MTFYWSMKKEVMTIIQHISPPCTIPWQLQCVCFRPNDGFACSIISQTRMISITANISMYAEWTGVQ